MLILLSALMVSTATATEPSESCAPLVIEHAEAKAKLFELTQLVYVRPSSPGVPDSDPKTVQFMVMDATDDRPSHVSDDGQVIYLRQEAVGEPCNATFQRLLDESYGKRLWLLQHRDGA